MCGLVYNYYITFFQNEIHTCMLHALSGTAAIRVATLFVLPLYMGPAYNGLLAGFCFRSFALKFTYFKQKISLF